MPAIVASPLAANLGGEMCELTFPTSAGRIERLGRQTKVVAAGRLVELIAEEVG